MHGVEVSFPDTSFSSLIVDPRRSLSHCLTVDNSPVLFGCRTGICGTCLVKVQGQALPPSEEEREVINLLAPNSPQARLACQLQPTESIQIWKWEANHDL